MMKTPFTTWYIEMVRGDLFIKRFSIGGITRKIYDLTKEQKTQDYLSRYFGN